jgi:hypothetical protein
VDNAEEKIQQKEDCSDGNIRYDLWLATETLVARSIWWAICNGVICLRVCYLNVLARQILAHLLMSQMVPESQTSLLCHQTHKGRKNKHVSK